MKNLKILFGSWFVLFAIAFTACSPVLQAETAEEKAKKLAPILHRQGVLVVYFNLQRIELDNWAAGLTAFFDANLPESGFDQKSQKGIMDEWKKLVAKKIPELNGYLTGFFEETGIRDLYFVSYFMKNDEVPPFFAVSANDMTDLQQHSLEKKLETLPHDGDIPWVRIQNVLMLPVSGPEYLSEDDADTLLEYFADFEAQPVPELAEALKCHEDALVTLVLLPPEHFPGMDTVFDEEFAGLEHCTRIWENIGKNGKWYSQGFYVDTLRTVAVLKMADENAVKEFEEARKALFAWAAEEIEQNLSKNDFMKTFARLMRVSFEEIARQIVPKQENDRLTVTIDASNFLLYYSFLGHFMFTNEEVVNE